MAMNASSLQQTGGRAPRTTMQAADMEGQATAFETMPSPPHFRQQPKSPRAEQQRQSVQRSKSISPSQQYAGVRRMSSASQAAMIPDPQDGRRQSPAKRVSYSLELEQGAEALPSFEESRYPSPMRRKTIAVEPASFEASRSLMAPSQQEVMVSRKSVLQQQQGPAVSPRKSVMNGPPSQPLSPTRSSFQQQLLPSYSISSRKSVIQEPLSPRKSMLQQPLSPRKSIHPQQVAGIQDNRVSSINMEQERVAPLSQKENMLGSSSYVVQKSMSTSPSVQMHYDDEDVYGDDDENVYGDDDAAYDDDGGFADDNGGGGAYDSENTKVSRSTSMSQTPPTVHFHDNRLAMTPTSSNNSMLNRSLTTVRPSKVTQANTNSGSGISPGLMQTRRQSQLPISPASLQSSISRSKSISPSQVNLEKQQSAINRSMCRSPTQMSMEQQQQPQSSAANVLYMQGGRPGSPPQLNRYLSTAAPRVSVVGPSKTCNVFQPPHLLPVSSYKQMQPVRGSLDRRASSSSGGGPLKHEWHLSVTDVALRSMAAIASAVAFCVMITNTISINNQTISFTNFAGFRYVAGISATAFSISILQLGVIISKKLRSHSLGMHFNPTRPCLFSSMFIDQVLAYLLLSAGSVGVGALLYLPSVCKSDTEISADFCSRSTLSVVLTLVLSTMFAMSAMLSTFRFYQNLIGLF